MTNPVHGSLTNDAAANAWFDPKPTVTTQVGLDTILLGEAIPSSDELRKLGVTELGTPVGLPQLSNAKEAAAISSWNHRMHRLGFRTYASLNYMAALQSASIALKLGFDDLELDEYISNHNASRQMFLEIVGAARALNPDTRFTVTEWRWSALQCSMRYFAGVPNVRIATDAYDDLSLVTKLAAYRNSTPFRLGAWVIIVDDPSRSWDSYKRLPLWLSSIKASGLDLLVFKIDCTQDWPSGWSTVMQAL